MDCRRKTAETPAGQARDRGRRRPRQYVEAAEGAQRSPGEPVRRAKEYESDRIECGSIDTFNFFCFDSAAIHQALASCVRGGVKLLRGVTVAPCCLL